MHLHTSFKSSIDTFRYFVRPKKDEDTKHGVNNCETETDLFKDSTSPNKTWLGMSPQWRVLSKYSQMLHNADIDVIQCLHAITFSTGLTQHNNLLNLRSIPSVTFIKHGIRNNGTNKSTSRGYQNIHLRI